MEVIELEDGAAYHNEPNFNGNESDQKAPNTNTTEPPKPKKPKVSDCADK